MAALYDFCLTQNEEAAGGRPFVLAQAVPGALPPWACAGRQLLRAALLCLRARLLLLPCRVPTCCLHLPCSPHPAGAAPLADRQQSLEAAGLHGAMLVLKWQD